MSGQDRRYQGHTAAVGFLLKMGRFHAKGFLTEWASEGEGGIACLAGSIPEVAEEIPVFAMARRVQEPADFPVSTHLLAASLCSEQRIS
jgi:hypothetical protein